MKADWFRSWHGAPTDGKWRMIASDVGCKPAEVAALVWALLDFASANDDRGSIEGFNVRVYAMDSGTDLPAVKAIVAALSDPELNVVAEGRFVNWNKRQPKREDATAADRQRDARARAKAPCDDDAAADRHATSRNVTLGHDLEERRGEGEEKEEERKAVDARQKRATRLASDFSVPSDWRAWAIRDRRWSAGDASEEAEMFVDFWRAKAGKDGAKLDWQATWRNWCRNSRRQTGRGGARAAPVANDMGMLVPC